MMLSPYVSKGSHQARVYTRFCSMKWLRVFLLPLDGMLVHHRVTPSIKFTGTHFYTWVEKGTVRNTSTVSSKFICKIYSLRKKSLQSYKNYKITAQAMEITIWQCNTPVNHTVHNKFKQKCTFLTKQTNPVLPSTKIPMALLPTYRKKRGYTI